MDMYRAFLAIIISFIILVGYQYFFVPAPPPRPEQQTVERPAEPAGQTVVKRQEELAAEEPLPLTAEEIPANPAARDIRIETPLYSAVIAEQGGGFKSFVLKKHSLEMDQKAGMMQLVQTGQLTNLPMRFTFLNGSADRLPLYHADRDKVILSGEGGKSSLIMTATSDRFRVIRTMVFDPASYLIEDSYQVQNIVETPQAIQPAVVLTNRPFAPENSASRFMFSGPVTVVNDELVEIKGKKLNSGSQVLQGSVSWAGYEDNYFLTAIIPGETGERTVTMSVADDTVRTVVEEGAVTIDAGSQREFTYDIYFGPKKLSILKEIGHDLSRAINFGWFDALAKPMLWLLNFFYKYIGNYGVAIILLTVLIKAVFWPVTQKGMKSMKNMQKLQPKVAKLKEKFKDDPQKMNQEMMALYKTYKVNPVGGCLPLILQIPFFFALYRVLLLSIELRHAPFMLWINDLSAPDRLWIGFDIPYLHGIPVMTLLMGASMYLQQKMSPTTADPSQARIMQMLPVIFTFMFLNFASGLVLYWFVNNLLSILQQKLINRQTRA